MNSKNKKSALTENKGIDRPEIVSESVVSKIQGFRKIVPSSQDLIQGIFNKDITALSRSISLIESTNTQHQQKATEVINACLPLANNSIRIGITGVPGVGKSTFIEAFGKYLTSLGKKVAVLAVDPSSTISHGSILGDKTRMEELVKDKNAYIRPSASGENLGGVARKTRETIILCEAFGFDTILIETVGVGQSETAVHSMVDFFLLLNLAGAGDELQGIKRGIMEMADAVVINKCDGQNVTKANLTKAAFNRAIHMFPAKSSGWSPKVATCSALLNTGIEELWQIILEYKTLTSNNNYFEKKRAEQNQYWLLETINNSLQNQFYTNPNVIAFLEKNKNAVQNNEKSPFEAANELLEIYFKSKV